MNRIEAAKTVASRINSREDFSAKFFAKNGAVRLYVSRDGGGKKGFQEVGQIEFSLAGEIEVGSGVKFACRYFPEVLAEALEGITCEAESAPVPADTRPADTRLADLAKAFRAGKALSDDEVFELQQCGHISVSAAMNRDF